MRLPRYPSYKDTLVPWIPSVPTHWQTLRADAVLETRVDQIAPEALSGIQVFHYSIPVVQKSGDGQIEDGTEILSSKLIVTEPCVLISKLNPRKGTVCIATPKAMLTVSSGEFVSLIPRGPDLRYVCYVVQSTGYRERLESMVESATRSHARVLPEDVRKFQWAFPTSDEQVAIATFLDRETAKIDALVAEQERLMALLREKRQTVISHAVTKGLNPDVATKPSGVDWLGEVPAHWRVDRIANLFREVADEGVDGLPILSVSIHTGVSDDELDEADLERKVTRSDDRTKYKRVAPHDLVYNMMRAWQGGFGTVSVAGMVSPAYVVARPRLRLRTDYIEHVLRTPNAVEQMRRHSRGVTDFRLRLYWDEFRNIRVPVPPSDEMDAICMRIAQLSAQFTAMTDACVETIDVLNQRRAALITAAVTGQIDVHQLAHA